MTSTLAITVADAESGAAITTATETITIPADDLPRVVRELRKRQAPTSDVVTNTEPWQVKWTHNGRFDALQIRVGQRWLNIPSNFAVDVISAAVDKLAEGR